MRSRAVKKIVDMTMFLFYLTGIFSCASHVPSPVSLYQFSLVKTSIEAKELQNYCRKSMIINPDVLKADSLFVVSKRFLNEGNEKEGNYNLELAISNYKIAITQKEQTDYKDKILELEKNLNATNSELITLKTILFKYKNVLTGLDTIR
jgi:hypothetical protein